MDFQQVVEQAVILAYAEVERQVAELIDRGQTELARTLETNIERIVLVRERETYLAFWNERMERAVAQAADCTPSHERSAFGVTLENLV